MAMEQSRPWEAARSEDTWDQSWTPVLGAIDELALTDPQFSVIEERFRQIAARCLEMRVPTTSQSIAVSSATPGDGKSSVAIGIAAAAARNLGTAVLLVEADLRRPELAEDFRLQTSIGLSDYLMSEVELKPCIQATRMQNVWLLPAGRQSQNPGPLMRSERFKDLMKTLHETYPTIIIDVPPLLTSADAAVIARQAEGLVLVVRAGRTHIQDAANALKAVRDVPVRGVVLNATREWFPGWVARLLGMSRFATE